MATYQLRTLTGNSPERIFETWLPPGDGLAPSLRCPGGSVSIVKTAKEAVWSTAFAPLPEPPKGGCARRMSWFVVAHKLSRFSVRVGVCRLSGSIQVPCLVSNFPGIAQYHFDWLRERSHSAVRIPAHGYTNPAKINAPFSNHTSGCSKSDHRVGILRAQFFSLPVLTPTHLVFGRR